MTHSRWLSIGLLFLATACTGPPQAPKRLDKLCGYLFGHVWDPDPAHLEAGLQNMRNWLKHHMAETEEGFTISRLSQKEVDKLDSCDRDIDGLVGAVVATRSSHAIDDLSHVLIEVPAIQVYEDTDFNKRFDFDPDADCFLDHECDHLRYETATEQNFAMGLYVRSLNTLQHRWIETDRGTAHVYRSWLQRPAEVNWDWLDVQSQFYLSATIPWEGGTARIQATWAVTELGNGHVPEGTALNHAIKTMRNVDEDVQAYLDSH
jgi:hypothetical protein